MTIDFRGREGERESIIVTYEARGIIVADGLRVSKGLQDRVGLKNLLLQLSNLVGLV
jgi:hypothetical protein